MTLAYAYALFAQHCKMAADTLEGLLVRDANSTAPLMADDVKELRMLETIANERVEDLVVEEGQEVAR